MTKAQTYYNEIVRLVTQGVGKWLRSEEMLDGTVEHFITILVEKFAKHYG